MGENGLSASDVAVLSGNYGRSNDGMFGGDWSAWIILFLLFGLFGNGNGLGFGGGFGGRGCGQPATVSDLTTQSIVGKLDGLTNGLSDSTYALNNAITSGFSGVQSTLCSGFNGISREIADCCCATQGAIKDVRYDLATQACDTRNVIQNSTRDILESNNANTRAILDFLTQDKIATLTAENQSLKLQASQSAQNAFITANQEAQTAELLRRLAPTPTPAYVVPNPNCCYNAQVSFANGCGCGCGSF